MVIITMISYVSLSLFVPKMGIGHYKKYASIHIYLHNDLSGYFDSYVGVVFYHVTIVASGHGELKTC